MNQASAALVGQHDFAAFCRQREGATTVRTLLDLSWTRDGDRLAVGDCARRRVLPPHGAVAGRLPARGRGGPATGHLGRRGAAPPRVRDAAVTVVPAHGLTLEEVAYPAPTPSWRQRAGRDAGGRREAARG